MGFNSGFKGLRIKRLGKNLQKICKDADEKPNLTSWQQILDTDFFYVRTHALVSRWDKCLNVSGDCREVWCVSSATYVQYRYRSQSGLTHIRVCGRVQLKYDGTRWRTGGETKGKLEDGVGSQYSSHYLGTWCIQHYYRWCAHVVCQ